MPKMRCNITIDKELKDYARTKKINISKLVSNQLYALKNMQNKNFISDNSNKYTQIDTAEVLSSNLNEPILFYKF